MRFATGLLVSIHFSIGVLADSPAYQTPHLTPEAMQVHERGGKPRPIKEYEIFRDRVPVQPKFYSIGDDGKRLALKQLLVTLNALVTDDTSDENSLDTQKIQNNGKLASLLDPESQERLSNPDRRDPIRVGDYVFLPPNRAGKVFVIEWARYIAEVNYLLGRIEVLGDSPNAVADLHQIKLKLEFLGALQSQYVHQKIIDREWRVDRAEDYQGVWFPVSTSDRPPSLRPSTRRR